MEENEVMISVITSLCSWKRDKSRRLRWTGHVARMEEGRSAFKILTGTPGEKIRMDLK